MSDNKVVDLHSIRTPIGHGIRTGEVSYRQVENLQAEGRLPVQTMIVDASKAGFQKEFISALIDAGVEVILDTKCAELSAIGKFQGMAKGAPWAPKEPARPFCQDDFQVGANTGVFNQIARFAVELGVNAMLSPSHLLKDGTHDSWFDVDCRSVELLRQSLDLQGGSNIGVDHTLIIPHTKLYDEKERA